jgi:hypothetical protein
MELNTELEVAAGTMYAICVRSPSSNVGTCPAWRYQNSDVYSGGTFVQSGDSGVTWNIYSGGDFAFQVIYTHNTRLTCKTAGVYYVCGNLNYMAYAAGDRQLYILLNRPGNPQGTGIITGGINIAEDTKVNAGSEASVTLGVNTRRRLEVGDYIELVTMQNTTARLTVRGLAQYCPVLGMQRIG